MPEGIRTFPNNYFFNKFLGNEFKKIYLDSIELDRIIEITQEDSPCIKAISFQFEFNKKDILKSMR